MSRTDAPPKVDEDFDLFIEAKALSTTDSAPAIYGALKEKFPNRRWPGLRSVQRLVADKRHNDPGEPWKMLEAPPACVALVMPVLAELIRRSEGRRAELTQAEAAAIARIRATAPSLDPYYAYLLAVIYISRVAHERATADLDLYLGIQPWVSDEHRAFYEDAVKRSGALAFKPWLINALADDAAPTPARLDEVDNQIARLAPWIRRAQAAADEAQEGRTDG